MNILRTIFALVFSILFLCASPGIALADTRQLEIEKFTDAPAFIAAIQKAKTDAQAISGSRSDAEHIEKVVKSLNDALAAGLSAENLEHFFNDVRQGIDALERVNAAKIIAANLAEAARVATEKFLVSVERAIPRLADTKTREKAAEDFAKAKDDYARGIAAISAGRRNEAINHFRAAIRKMVRYPLRTGVSVKSIQTVIETDPNTNPISPIFDQSGRMTVLATKTEFRFLNSGVVIPKQPGEWIVSSKNGEFFAIRKACLAPEFQGHLELGLAFYDSMGNFLFHRDGLQKLTLISDNGNCILTTNDIPDDANGLTILDGSGNVLAASDIGTEFDIAISPLGSKVIYGARSKTILIDVLSGQKRSFPRDGLVDFVGEDRFVLADDGTSGVKLMSLNGDVIWQSPMNSSYIAAVKTASDGKSIAVAQENSLHVMDAADGSLRWSTSLPFSVKRTRPELSNDANIVGITGYDSTAARIYDETGDLIYEYASESDEWVVLHISKEGLIIHLTTPSRVIRVELVR